MSSKSDKLKNFIFRNGEKIVKIIIRKIFSETQRVSITQSIMLSQPIFDDRALSESFYKSLFKRLCESFDGSTQALLSECTFGIAPSPAGENTFFIVAPCLEVAEELTDRIDQIQNQVNSRIAGIKQTAICVKPSDCDPQQISTQFMLGKIFPHSPDDRTLNEDTE